ncbi:hypothetical protein [uncultured Amaricoccus sp.]|uniref:hypothetical protein n=1 Tax=uncultured Amaricoccus sp. TaxID=339341 RepID=UPI002606F260|nr:hypothetical protein [uncultured Amaricoccus sp.]
MGRRADGAGCAAAALAMLLLAGALPARAQMDPEEEQRCVWQCLANSPGAESRQYQECVERLCMAAPPAAEKPRAAVPAGAAWTAGSGARGGGWYAGVEIPGKSLSFLCRRGGPGLLAVAGLGGRADGVALRVDRQAFALRFVAENGILYAAADSPLLGALMGGSRAEVSARGGSATFPLAGSGAAIRKALAGCGLS